MASPDAFAIAGLAVSLGVGLIFATAGASKLRHRLALEGVVANYRLLPPVLIRPAAFLLPWLELTVATALVTGMRPLPQWTAAALLLVFAAAMAINLRRGRAHIDCGCGSSAMRQPLSAAAVVRNLVLAALLVVASTTSDVTEGAAIVAATAGGAGLFLFYLIFNAIEALSRTSPAAMGR